MVVVGRSGRIVGLLILALVATACVVVRDGPPQRRPGVTTPRTSGFSTHERRIVQEYFAGAHPGRGCPPGLAKKRNGCLPPGQAKKRYAAGHPLPADVVVLPLPRELAIRIGRPPRGYRYGVVDGDVVKLVVGSLLVVDAIVGLGS